MLWLKEKVSMSLKALLTFFILTASLFSQDICGFWKTIDPKTHRAESIVAIYSHQGTYYGRIMGSYNAEGKIDDSIYAPKGRAPGVQGEPYYSSFDFIWGLKPDGDGHYEGKIMDPRKGKIYNAELWVNGKGELVVRGKLFIFGQNRIWPPAQESDFSSPFKKPDPSQFIPTIPVAK
jgi:uncharacterized protein (DUF2147 family)